MSPGAKVFLTLLGVGGTFGVLAIVASKKAGAATLPKDSGGTVVVPPHDGLPPVVTPSEPESGFDRTGPFAVPGVQDAAEASQHLLRWWASEGQSLVGSDTDPHKPSVPGNFGNMAADLDGSFGPRTQQVAAAFEHYNGLTPEDGVLSNPLLLALRRWAQSQALPPAALPPAQSSAPPAPIVLPSTPQSPLGGSAPPFVPLPPIVPPAPVVPVPPFIPAPPLASQQPPTPLPPLVAPLPAPPGPVPLPPVLSLPAPPVATQAPPVASGTTTVHADTAAMVNALLTAEGSAGWNKADPTVQAWQQARGLKVDGLFGPKSALTVAQEFGTVPIIRVWPSGSVKAKALQDYRAALVALANQTSNATQAAQLRVSAQREQAQGFGPKRGTAPALPSGLQVQIGKVA